MSESQNGKAIRPCVAVIGVGTVGAGLGARAAKAGYRVIFGVRDPRSDRAVRALANAGGDSSVSAPALAAQQADLLIFAVPWLQCIAAIESLGDLAGKIIVDVTNPISHAPGGGAIFQLAMSISEYLQTWAPKSSVVKAFNASNQRTLASPELVEGPITVPIAGDDAEAKAKVAALATAIGFDPFDVGALRNARYLEAMALLYIDMNAQNRPDGFEFYFRRRAHLRSMPAA